MRNEDTEPTPPATRSHDERWPAPTVDELAALDQLPARGGTWTLGEHDVKLTNLDKELFPERGRHRAFTKRDLVRHYSNMAPWLLPYLADRPINLNRFPDGIAKSGFWHKAAPDHAPPWVRRWRYEEAKGNDTEMYSVLDSPAALAWAANFGAIELHPWTSTVDHPRMPSWAMIDIDPGDASTFDDVLLLARLHRTALDQLGVQGGAKVTGQRGIQVWVPVADGYTFDDTRTWVERLSRIIGNTVPDMVSWEWQVAKRRGRTRLDYTQNAINKTLVAPFSVRPAPGAPVSVPIEWDELDDPTLRPDRWTMATIGDRLVAAGDPLARLRGLQQHLPAI